MAPTLQGMAESRDLEDFDGRPFSYCLISRRCRLHVGPRYKARGLNEQADPGNEIECDQVVWKHSTAAGKPLAWSRWEAAVAGSMAVCCPSYEFGGSGLTVAKGSFWEGQERPHPSFILWIVHRWNPWSC